MFVIYGVYIVTFGLSVHTLSRHNPLSSKLYVGATVTLFVLATFYTAAYVWGVSRQTMIYFKAATTKDYTALLDYLAFNEKKTAWFSILNLAATFMNVVADIMLIHRCCIIWQSRIVMYLLASIAVFVNGIFMGSVIAGVIGASTSNHYLFETGSAINNATGIPMAVFQVILALMTGGRIWWISRHARRCMGQSTNMRYNSITSIIIESGILYATCLVLSLTLPLVFDPHAEGIVPFDFSPVVALMSGLAPTMIIVRVAQGKSVDSVQQVVSTLQFADARENSQRSGPAVETWADARAHSDSENTLPMPATSYN
ncbi:hypothetical protein L218DRAFT_188768 [Marasmius fiardii PR-910]|nr:hypothetical protein L218DRAFT_188768 [Marasmius fiardii PR-910]